jgi:hypothetical protein
MRTRKLCGTVHLKEHRIRLERKKVRRERKESDIQRFNDGMPSESGKRIALTTRQKTNNLKRLKEARNSSPLRFRSTQQESSSPIFLLTTPKSTSVPSLPSHPSFIHASAPAKDPAPPSTTQAKSASQPVSPPTTTTIQAPTTLRDSTALYLENPQKSSFPLLREQMRVGTINSTMQLRKPGNKRGRWRGSGGHSSSGKGMTHDTIHYTNCSTTDYLHHSHLSSSRFTGACRATPRHTTSGVVPGCQDATNTVRRTPQRTKRGFVRCHCSVLTNASSFFPPLIDICVFTAVIWIW